MLTHRNLVANAKHTLIAVGYVGTDSYLHAPPMFHIADGASTFAVTWVGGRHVIIPAFDPERWMGAVEDEKVTRALLVPTMINMVVNHPAFEQHDLSSLRGLWYAASPMPGEFTSAGLL
jgi:long-chain acyl-CoA synthetase